MRPAEYRWAIIAAAAVRLLVPALAAAQDSTGVVARMASVTGAAAIYTAGTGTAFTAAAGFVLNPGDRVDTRGGGRVTIELSDGSMVVVEPQSIVTLKDFRQAASLRELFEIALGRVRVRINHFGGRPNPYRMNSPTASIAVRGTEFSITVTAAGDTEVVVYEGAVEVTSLADPSQSVFVEAGRGVLVQGRDFHRIAAAGGLGGRERHDGPGGNEQRAFAPANALGGAAPGHGDHDSPTPRATASAYDSYIAGLSDIAQMPFLFRFNAFAEAHLDSLENPAYATQFTTPEGRLFVLPTFGGGNDLDDVQRGFGAVGAVPRSYSISPQLSMFGRVGDSNYFAGGSFSSSRAVDGAVTLAPDEDSGQGGKSSSSATTGSSTTSFYSGSLVAARRFGRSSAGVELESMRGRGSLSSATADYDGRPSLESILAVSRFSQTRITAGLSHDFGAGAKLGVFYRYGWIQGRDHDLSHTMDGNPVGLNATDTTGHSSEIGFRLRGAIRPNLLYGVTGAWLGVALGDALARTTAVDSTQRDRAQRTSLGFGLGYAITRRTVLTFDLAGGLSRASSTRLETGTGNLLQNSAVDGRFFSTHAAVQTELSRHLFVSASFLNVWRHDRLNVDLFPDRFGATSLVQDSFFPITPNASQRASRFSDFGVGWRFSPSFFVQYLFSTDYGVTAPSHALMLRYTFRLRHE